LLIPLSIQQSKSVEYTKALKPYMNEIRERFKNNENAMNQAMGKLYEDADQNPLNGCLLSLAQIPIFLGLYRGVRLLAMDGKLEEPFLWIPSLEGPVSGPNYNGLDWLVQGWTADPTGAGQLPWVPPLGWETTLAFLVMPVILVLLQSFTMTVLQPPTDDAVSEEEKKTLENSQRVLKFLPLLIGVFSLQVPAGLTIYWCASNIFTLSQSLTVRAYFAANPPNITLPEYWDKARDVQDKDFADLTPEERRQATEMGIKIGPTMADLIDAGRFHVFIERPPLRQSTAAWERINKDDSGILATTNSDIPEALQHWVSLKMEDLATKTNNIDDKQEPKDHKPAIITTETTTKSEVAAAATNTTTIMQA
jgi:YidC/Oxa1 family membrane protein insertase